MDSEQIKLATIGKTIKNIIHKESELIIEFTDGTMITVYIDRWDYDCTSLEVE